MNDDIFGPVPLGAPESMLRYGNPTLFDVIHAINANGQIAQGSQAALAAKILRTAAKSPDLKWGTILGGAAGAGAGLLGARHLTNLNDKSQYGVAGVAGMLGALIGRAIQRAKHKTDMNTPRVEGFIARAQQHGFTPKQADELLKRAAESTRPVSAGGMLVSDLGAHLLVGVPFGGAALYTALKGHPLGAIIRSELQPVGTGLAGGLLGAAGGMSAGAIAGALAQVLSKGKIHAPLGNATLTGGAIGGFGGYVGGAVKGYEDTAKKINSQAESKTLSGKVKGLMKKKSQVEKLAGPFSGALECSVL